ncbi:hypothetical protein H8958_012505 [Nasalis larvatus]
MEPWPCSAGGGGGGTRARHVIINVGGCRVRLAWAALARCPLARLERLRACRGHDELLRVCDDYDVSRDEFFFDRSPCAFRAIVALLRAGKLRLLRGPCALAFRDELAYWGIDEARLERCCLRRLRRREEAVCGGRVMPQIFPKGSPPHSCAALLPLATLKMAAVAVERGLWEMPAAHHGPLWRLLPSLEAADTDGNSRCRINPGASTVGRLRSEKQQTVGAQDSTSELGGRDAEEASPSRRSSALQPPPLLDSHPLGECSPKCRSLFVLETVCVAWFSFEFLLRSLQAESKCAFLRAPLNIIDILALLPFYVSLLLGLAAGPGGTKLLERAGLVLRLLRALRVLYVMRLARHSLGLRSLGLTVRRCAREFGLLLLFLCVAMALFAPLVHLAERELGARRDFSSVPASYWWAVISMTTVGYGDMVPRSLPGQVVALSSILSGILLMAFPVTSIFHTFSRSYSELKEQQQRATSPEPALREDSTRSATATEDSSQGPDGVGQAADSADALWVRAER